MLNLLWVVVLIFAALWVFGMATSYTMGGLLHVLLVLAVIMLIVRLVVGRRGN